MNLLPQPVAESPGVGSGTPQSLRVGGLTPFSSVDYPGQLAAVVFVSGCAWRCGYCHNPHLQLRQLAPGGAPEWPQILTWLARRTGLLDAVVFSGGEPTTDGALSLAIRQTRDLGFRIGLHTAGLYPQRLRPLLPLLDWVGLDIKAPHADGALHSRITGVRHSERPVRESLALLLESGVQFECRSTVHPQWLDDDALRVMGSELAAAGVAHYALQIYRPDGSAQPQSAVPAGYPSAEVLAQLRSAFRTFTVRDS